MTDIAGQPTRVSALLRERDYMAFWLSRVAGGLSYTIQSVTLGWLTYDIARRTHSIEQSALYVGLIGFCTFLPMFVLALPAGQIADRHERKHIMIACGVSAMALNTLLASAALFGFASIPLFFGIAFLLGISRVLRAPAGTALAPMLVPRELLPRAIAFNSLSNQTATIMGPALGGLLIAVSPWVAFSACVAFDLAGVALIALIKRTTKPQAQPGSRLELIKEGLRYIWTNKVVFGSISLDLFAVLLGSVGALLPVFARDVLPTKGPEIFGLLRSSPAVGAMIAALTLANHPIRRHAGPKMLAAVAVYGLATLIFAFSRLFWLSALALALVGASDMLSVFVRQTLVQLMTPDHMRGRVAAVSTLFISASNDLGEFESGIAARILGPIGAAIFGGVGSLLVTGSWAKLFPALRKADRLE
ncbi:MAG: MFS transporter [Alphaproteobacteria bacterium]